MGMLSLQMHLHSLFLVLLGCCWVWVSFLMRCSSEPEHHWGCPNTTVPQGVPEHHGGWSGTRAGSAFHALQQASQNQHPKKHTLLPGTGWTPGGGSPPPPIGQTFPSFALRRIFFFFGIFAYQVYPVAFLANFRKHFFLAWRFVAGQKNRSRVTVQDRRPPPPNWRGSDPLTCSCVEPAS